MQLLKPGMSVEVCPRKNQPANSLLCPYGNFGRYLAGLALGNWNRALISVRGRVCFMRYLDFVADDLNNDCDAKYGHFQIINLKIDIKYIKNDWI